MSDAGNVNFRALQLFIAVYDSQSFSVVARREGVSPSMVSRVIHQLEDSLGQQLFYRNTRAVVPTDVFLPNMPEASANSSAPPDATCRIGALSLGGWCESTPRSTLASAILRHGYRV